MLPQAWPQPCPSGPGVVPVTLPPISMGLDPDGFSGIVRVLGEEGRTWIQGKEVWD